MTAPAIGALLGALLGWIVWRLSPRKLRGEPRPNIGIREMIHEVTGELPP